MYNTMNNPSAHPSYSHYYLLSPSTLFFVFFFCTSYCFFAHLVVFLHISLSFAHLIVFCTSYCFLHILLFCTFLFHCTFYSYFSFSYHMYALVLCYLYNLYSYCFALSTERTWFDCISLLVMPCITIMWQIKKPWTLKMLVCVSVYISLVSSMISFSFGHDKRENQLMSEVFVIIFDEVCVCECYSAFKFDLRLNDGMQTSVQHRKSYSEYTRMNGLISHYVYVLMSFPYVLTFTIWTN